MKIILADDHPEVLKIVAKLLRRVGHEVYETKDGQEALDLQFSIHADLLITDMIMPRKNGLETILAFKSQFPGVKVIATSAGGKIQGDDTLEVAKGAGADAIFAKSGAIQDLLKIIAEFERR
jgi:CheY-like chemotaxis protein